jgi:hypothetical protein
MIDKVLVWKYVDSCETCPCGIREQFGKFRCSEDPDILFQQNRDNGVPGLCPFRKKVPPCI